MPGDPKECRRNAVRCAEWLGILPPQISGSAAEGYRVMLSKSETLLHHRDRRLCMAEMAPTEAIRAKLLSVARLYEIEVNLIGRARQSIADSKDLIIRAEALLSPRLSRRHAYDPKTPPLPPSHATVAPNPSTPSEASDR